MPTVRKRRIQKQKSGKVKSSNRQQDKLKKIIVQGPPALVKEWDVKQTAAQNYERLGLHIKRPMAIHQSGGVERLHAVSSQSSKASTSKQALTEATEDDSDDDDEEMSEVEDDDEENDGRHTREAQPPTLRSKDIPKGFARIERDAQGNVLRVVMSAWDADEEDAQMGEGGDDFEGGAEEAEAEAANADADADAAPTTTPWGAPLTNTQEEERLRALAKPVEAKNQAIRDLEAQARSQKAIPAASLRFTSPAERTFLLAMYAKYGNDVPAMARDIKLNRDQRTTGQLRRMFAKAGGLENFAKMEAQVQ